MSAKVTPNKRILLIWPPGIAGADWMLFPLAFGFLRNHADCDILDCTLTPLSPLEIAQRASAYDLVGITVWGFNVRTVQHLTDLIHQHTNAKVVVGGPSAGLVKADYALLGEAEEKFGELAAQVLSGGNAADLSIQGLGINGKSQAKMPASFTGDLDELGLVDYGALGLGRYNAAGYKYWLYTLSDKFTTGPMMATRGCPYKCTFCAAPALQGVKLRKHSVDYVLATIEDLYFNHDVRQISFLDDNLTLDAAWAKDLCVSLIKLKEAKGMEFICSTSNGVRYKTLDDELLGLMRRAGWGEIVLAPESGSPRTLERMKKYVDLDVLEEKAALAKKNGLNTVGFFIIGYPGETPEDLEMTRAYIHQSGLTRTLVNWFNPIPGTPIYYDLVEAGEIDPEQIEINYGSIDKLDYLTPGLTKDDLRAFDAAVKSRSAFTDMKFADLLSVNAA